MEYTRYSINIVGFKKKNIYKIRLWWIHFSEKRKTKFIELQKLLENHLLINNLSSVLLTKKKSKKKKQRNTALL